MTTFTPDEAINRCKVQSEKGPAFPRNECKKRTRMAYGVESDGSGSAAAAWHRTDYRVRVAGDKAPRGALVWWVGGSDGNGHVAIADGKGGVWSVDILRPGYWGHVAYATIGREWTALRFAGVSLDIDGVRVVQESVATLSTRLTILSNQLNGDRIIDLDLLDALIKAGRPAVVATAARAAKWACINGVRAVLKAGGR